MRQNIFMTVALLIGLGLIVLSFYLTPLVENSTDRAKQATRGVQILGVAIFCISATKLTCQESDSNFNILLGIMFLLGGVCTGLFSIIHNDCVDARTFTPYALGVSVCIMIGSFIGIFVNNRKTKIKEDAKPRYGISREQLEEDAMKQQQDYFKNDGIDSESSTETTPNSDDIPESRRLRQDLLQKYDHNPQDIFDPKSLALSKPDIFESEPNKRLSTWKQFENTQKKMELKKFKSKPPKSKRLSTWNQYENKIKDMELEESPLGGGRK